MTDIIIQCALKLWWMWLGFAGLLIVTKIAESEKDYE